MTLLAAPARRRTPADPPPELFTLNTIPTYDGSGNTIHPSVVDMGASGWNGYRWWLADTPYPNNNDDLENPSIFASNDRVTWEVPTGLTNPIEPAPPDLAKWNSDVELVWDATNARMICYWRTNYGGQYLHAATSTEGVNWTKQTTPPVAFGAITYPHQSPGIAQDPSNGTWRMWFFGGGNYTTVGHWTAIDPLGPWTNQGIVTVTGAADAASVYKYHGDVIPHQGKWLAAFGASPGWALRVMVSDDGTNWRLSSTNYAPGFGTYRPTLTPSTEDGYIDVWFSDGGDLRVYYTRIHEDAWLDIP